MKFSVITINYNNYVGLRSTIESVVQQTYLDYEFIVIDGGSTDGSVDVIKEFADKITFWVSEKDRGIYHAMNKGVEHAHGEYCIFMNSGDSFYNSSVLELIEKCKPEEDVVIGKSLNDSKVFLPPPPSCHLTLYYFYSSSLPHQSSFIRTSLLKENPYDETLRIVADWKFFMQVIIFNNGTYRFVDIKVANFDVSGISNMHPEKSWEEKYNVLKNMFPSRVLEDYQQMKQSECLTQTLTPLLRKCYGVDRIIYQLGKLMLKIKGN